MQISEAIEFVAERKNAMLLAIKSDGRPQSSNVVYVVNDAGQILISVTEGRAKTKNLRRDPRASLHINRDDFWAYVVVEADVQLTAVAASPYDDTVDQLVEYFRAVAGEHNNWDDYRQAMVDDQRLIMTLTPTHAYGMLHR